MSDETLKDSVVSGGTKSFLEILTQKPTINILIYTDGKIIDATGDWGISELKNQLKAHQPASADICVILKNRMTGKPEDKLDKLLHDDTYSQTWFFGHRTLNKEEHNQPLNPPEYDQAELVELFKWMKKGSVLMAGDHSEEDPRLNPPEQNKHENYLGLGRALGRQVPRAGQLRKWKGPPTTDPRDSHNTQVLLCHEDFHNSVFESDATPQLLILKTFDSVTGEPLPVPLPFPKGRPHQIFEGMKDGERCLIRVFPDHTHDGEVIIPSCDDLEEWPEANGGVAPYPVAWGIDKRQGKRYIQLALYDGNRAGVGRIAADSTWHHYLNDNLRGFTTNTADPSIINRIGQFYSNLALWLASFDVRRSMAFFTFHKLAQHPRVLEEMSGPVINVGDVAYNILLKEKATPCEIHELLQVAVPAETRKQYPTLYFPASNSIASPLPSQQLLLGSIVSKWHQEIPAVIDSTGNDEAKIAQAEKFINEAYEDAVKIHWAELAQIYKQADKFQQALKRDDVSRL